MPITPARLAAECDRLADEVDAGTAPEFGTEHLFVNGAPCCAIGHVASRVGLTECEADDDQGLEAVARALGAKSWRLPREVSVAAFAVTNANDDGRPVASPLRDLARALRDLPPKDT